MDANSFHRLLKVLADSGETQTVEEAQNVFARYGVKVVCRGDIAHDVVSQVIALTVINAASRSFMGNVAIDCTTDFALTAPGFVGWKVSEFATWAGVCTLPNEFSDEWPSIYIGDRQRSRSGRSVHPWADGWSFGLGDRPRTCEFFAPACVAAGGLAVSEAFSILRDDNRYAGRRSLHLSLWQPGIRNPDAGPSVNCLPARSVWLIGLGHLGQANAWTLGFFEGLKPQLYVQDVDRVTRSTISTSMLSTVADIGKKKTRLTATWLEERGFDTAIVERRFDEVQRVGIGEPRTALFGVDNAAARRVIEGAGFETAIDVGLGAGFNDFRGIRMRTFPGRSSAAELWAADSSIEHSDPAPAYRAMLDEGADACGVTTLATRAVGAPFVGCVAAAFAVSEVVRRAVYGGCRSVVDLTLRDPEAVFIVTDESLSSPVTL